MVEGWKKRLDFEGKGQRFNVRNGWRFQEMVWGGKKWLEVSRNGWRFSDIITVDRHSKGYNWMKLNWIGLGRIGRKYGIKKNWVCSEWLRMGSVRFLVNYKDRKGLNLI